MADFETEPRPKKKVGTLVEESFKLVEESNARINSSGYFADTKEVPGDTVDERNMFGSGNVIQRKWIELRGWWRIGQEYSKYRYSHARLFSSWITVYKRGQERDGSVAYALEILNNIKSPSGEDVLIEDSREFDPLTELSEDDLIIKALTYHLEEMRGLAKRAEAGEELPPEE